MKKIELMKQIRLSHIRTYYLLKTYFPSLIKFFPTFLRKRIELLLENEFISEEKLYENIFSLKDHNREYEFLFWDRLNNKNFEESIILPFIERFWYNHEVFSSKNLKLIRGNLSNLYFLFQILETDFGKKRQRFLKGKLFEYEVELFLKKNNIKFTFGASINFKGRNKTPDFVIFRKNNNRVLIECKYCFYTKHIDDYIDKYNSKKFDKIIFLFKSEDEKWALEKYCPSNKGKKNLLFFKDLKNDSKLIETLK